MPDVIHASTLGKQNVRLVCRCVPEVTRSNQRRKRRQSREFASIHLLSLFLRTITDRNLRLWIRKQVGLYTGLSSFFHSRQHECCGDSSRLPRDVFCPVSLAILIG